MRRASRARDRARSGWGEACCAGLRLRATPLPPLEVVEERRDQDLQTSTELAQRNERRRELAPLQPAHCVDGESATLGEDLPSQTSIFTARSHIPAKPLQVAELPNVLVIGHGPYSRTWRKIVRVADFYYVGILTRHEVCSRSNSISRAMARRRCCRAVSTEMFFAMASARVSTYSRDSRCSFVSRVIASSTACSCSSMYMADERRVSGQTIAWTMARASLPLLRS